MNSTSTRKHDPYLCDSTAKIPRTTLWKYRVAKSVAQILQTVANNCNSNDYVEVESFKDAGLHL